MDVKRLPRIVASLQMAADCKKLPTFCTVERHFKFTEETAIVPQAFNPQPFGIFSSAAWQAEGRVLHLSGQVAQAADGHAVGVGDIEVQTRQVLASVGGRLDDIVRVTVFVADMAHLDPIHRVRAEYFTPPYPASTLVEVSRLVRAEYLIEIDAVASISYDRVQEPVP